MIKYDFSADDNLELYPYNVTLNITNACNLACKYCYVYQENKHMPLDIAIKTVDFMAKNLFIHKNQIKDIDKNTKAPLIFFGGEPLLRFNEIIVPTVEYCNQKYPNQFSFIMTTNGTLLKEPICKFISKNNFDVMLSFDGIKQIQDTNRPHQNQKISSYDLIIENMPYIQEYLPGLYPRATIDINSVPYIYETYLLFEQLGFSSCDFAPEYFTDLSADSKIYQQLQEQIHKIYEHRIKQYQYNMTPPITLQMDHLYLKMIFKRDLLKLLGIQKEKEPIYLNTHCGFNLGQLSVDYQGNIYPCREECVAYNKTCPTIIGNINTGFDFEAITQIRDQVANIESNFLNNQTCNTEDCFFYMNDFPCRYMVCPAHTLRKNKIFNSLCKYLECFIKETIQSMQILVAENNVPFIQYLNTFSDYRLIQQILSAPNETTRNFIIQQIKSNTDYDLSFEIQKVIE